MFLKKIVTKFGRTIFGISCLCLAACTVEDDKPFTDFSKGVLIVNEGSTVGTLSLYDKKSGAVQNDVFEKANGGATIGNSFQSMSFSDTKAYLIAGKSNKIVITDPKTFQTTGTITGFEQPRFILYGGKRAFISQWGNDGMSGNLQVIDLDSSRIVKTVATGKGPDRMAYVNNYLWILNSGGLGKDSTITVLDIVKNADSLVKTISVPLGPNSIVKDANGEAWILCGGYADRNQVGKLIKIKNDKIELSFDVPKLARNLVSDKSGYNLYFLAEGKIWQKDIQNFGKTAPSVLNIKKSFQYPYALGVNTETDNTENIYCGDALELKSSGTVFVIDKTTLAIKDSVKVGIGPNAFIFRQ
jgi:YVTN family beta-propeller protein